MEKRWKLCPVIVGLLLTSFMIPPVVKAIRRKSGSGELSPGESLIKFMDTEAGDLMYGDFKATGGILELGILHEDSYVEDKAVNTLACFYYKAGSEGTFNFHVDLSGDWYFVLSNPTPVDVEYEYEWIKKTTDEQLIETAGWFTIPAVILLIIVYVLFIRKKRQ